MANSKPRVIWEDYDCRIVRDGVRSFTVETMNLDALGAPSWVRIGWLQEEPSLPRMAAKMPMWALTSILEKLSRRRRRRKASR